MHMLHKWLVITPFYKLLLDIRIDGNVFKVTSVISPPLQKQNKNKCYSLLFLTLFFLVELCILARTFYPILSHSGISENFLIMKI